MNLEIAAESYEKAKDAVMLAQQNLKKIETDIFQGLIDVKAYEFIKVDWDKLIRVAHHRR